jgi:hypothetical protein
VVRRVSVWVILLSDAVDGGGDRGAAVHAAALMRSFGIVFDEVSIEDDLHLLEGREPGAAALDAEMLVEEGAVQALEMSLSGMMTSAPLVLAVSSGKRVMPRPSGTRGAGARRCGQAADRQTLG